MEDLLIGYCVINILVFFISFIDKAFEERKNCGPLTLGKLLFPSYYLTYLLTLPLLKKKETIKDDLRKINDLINFHYRYFSAKIDTIEEQLQKKSKK